MITFKQFILEVFDNPYPLESEYHSRYSSRSIFKVDDITYIISLDLNMTELDVTLIAQVNGKQTVLPTNLSKSPSRVYATVYTAIKKFVEQHRQKIRRIKLEAVAGRTKPLYEKLAKKLAKDIGGYFEERNYIATIVLDS